MSESCCVEVYENESFHRLKGWIPHPEFPFVIKGPNYEPCKPFDEIAVPSMEWSWSTNWKIMKMPGVTDAEGWEYASRFARFKKENRRPKSEAVWSRARRRLWTRIMRREAQVKHIDIPKITSKVQLGLTSIHAARLKIEEIMRQMPDAAETDQMRSLVTSVNKNIVEILAVIDSAEKQCQQNQEQLLNDEKNKANSFHLNGSSANGSSSSASPATNTTATSATNALANTPAVLKKLRNDVLKEQAAIERALDPSIPNHEPSSSSSSSSGNNKHNNNNNNNGSNLSTPQRHLPKGSSSTRGPSFSNGNNNTTSNIASSYSRTSFKGSSFNGSNNNNRPGKSDSITGPNDRRLFTGDPTTDAQAEYGTNNHNGAYTSGNNGSELSRMFNNPNNNNKKGPAEVKSGSVGSFNPSMLINNSMTNMNAIKLNEHDEVEDGVFVDRSTQDMIIAQKLIPIDEVTVMQEIIDERHTEIEKIHKGLVEVNNLFNDLSKIVKEQEVEINTIYQNAEESHQKTKEAFAHIIEANRLQQTQTCIIS